VTTDLLAFSPSLEATAESERLRELARAALERRSDSTLTIVSVQAPLVPVEELLRLRAGDAVLWAPPEGYQLAGLGAAREITAQGAERFGDVRRAAAELWRGVCASKQDAPPPRLFGGFAFQPRRAAGAPWSGFGEARFVLPRIGYVRDERRAWLSLAVGPTDLGSEVWRARFGELDRLRSELVRRAEQGAADGAQEGVPRVRALEERPLAEWVALVEAIRAEIAAGRFEKIVAARRATLWLDPPPDPVRVLGRLRLLAATSTRFAVRRGTACFLGATPERLLARRGLAVETEALAGSIRAGDPARARELLESAKERGEHAFVVRGLIESLGPLAAGIQHPEAPVVRELRHVYHLCTPVRASLREPHHVLELIERVHPTPAVGGLPSRAALEWIFEHEPDERGWYAGPVGWFDAEGDGEFAVALRSGVLDGERAHLYAGAGIVRASDARSEWTETRLKLASLVGGLGLAPDAFGKEAS
jgi:salicylate biosynthesis isochorismate synthase